MLMAKQRNDYHIRPYATKLNPERKLWQVYIGEDEVITTCRSLEGAQELVRNLNIDPWFLGRMQTRDDRNANRTMRLEW
jgi:hypothetical protein